MKQYTFFLLAALMSCFTALQAQNRVQLSVPDVVATASASEICVPVVADSFPNIAAVQFSLAWDTTKVSFQEVRFGANPLDLSDMTTSMPVSNNFGVTFTTNDLRGITLASGTVLFELCFTATMSNGSTPITFDGFLPGEFVQEGTIVAFPQTLIAGSITYGEDVATTIYPGDTNADGQVDHLDLLNIGLIHGTSGPARSVPGSLFAETVAPLWPGTLLSSLNHANVDADGDGNIADADLGVVVSNYGQVISGAYQPATGLNSTQGPALTLAGGPINAGETSTLTVMLGNGNDPLAVGYGLAFFVDFDPAQVDVNTLSVNFANSYLGSDLLTIARISQVDDSRLEIALSRKDQLNATAPGGELCRISFTALNNAAGGNYNLSLQVSPNAFLLSDQSSAAIQGSTTNIMVLGTVASREPAWAQGLRIYPNPYTSGPLSIRGDLPVLDRVTVVDAVGRQVLRFTANSRELDLSGLPAGGYLLQLESGGKKVSRKVVKQ